MTKLIVALVALTFATAPRAMTEEEQKKRTDELMSAPNQKTTLDSRSLENIETMVKAVEARLKKCIQRGECGQKPPNSCGPTKDRPSVRSSAEVGHIQRKIHEIDRKLDKAMTAAPVKAKQFEHLRALILEAEKNNKMSRELIDSVSSLVDKINNLALTVQVNAEATQNTLEGSARAVTPVEPVEEVGFLEGWTYHLGLAGNYASSNSYGAEAQVMMHQKIPLGLKFTVGATQLQVSNLPRNLKNPTAMTSSVGVYYLAREDVALDLHGRWIGTLGPHRDYGRLVGLGLHYLWVGRSGTGMTIGLSADYQYGKPPPVFRYGYLDQGFVVMGELGFLFRL